MDYRGIRDSHSAAKTTAATTTQLHVHTLLVGLKRKALISRMLTCRPDA